MNGRRLVKLLRLSDELRPQFLKMLRGGITFGRIMAKRSALQKGVLWAWVPPSVENVEPRHLREGLGMPIRYCKAFYSFLDDYFERRPDGIVIGDTANWPESAYHQSHPNQYEPAYWFSCESHPRWHSLHSEHFSVYLTKDIWGRKSFEVLMGCYWPNPSVTLLTSLPPGKELTCGEHYRLSSEMIRLLAERAEHLLMSVFDFDSLAIWTRDPGGPI